MKYIFSLMVAALLLLPATAGADTMTYEEAWSGYLYRFPLSYEGGLLTLADRYRIWTGEAPQLSGGPWTLWIENGRGTVIASYPFTADEGVFDIIVPAEDSGATAKFTGPDGDIILTVDLRGSRVCNDDGVCGAAAGERYENCPTDCGDIGAADRTSETATIASQVPSGVVLGGLVLRLASAAAGLMLLFGAARMLDSHRGQ